MDHLRGFGIEILRLVAWLLLLLAIFIPLERLWAVHPQRIFRREVWLDLGYYFLNSLLLTTLLVVPIAVLARLLHALVPGPLLALAGGLAFAPRVALAMLVGEFGAYWAHRWMHEVPFLWRFHAVHHNAEQIDWLVGTRAHPLDLVFTRVSAFIPMYVLGLAKPVENTADPVWVAIVIIGTIWGFFIHANARLRFGPLEWLVTTPAFHHWHHTNDARRDNNYSSLLPVMDWLFGTFYLPSRQWPPCYGIDNPLPDGLGEQLVYPLLPSRHPRPAIDPPREA